MFRKKTKEKILPDNASTFQKLWHNKKTHAAMVLGIYFICIIGLLIFINAMPKANPYLPKNNSNENKAVEYEKMKETLLTATFIFEYDITTPDTKVLYKGEKTQVATTGYKETKNKIIKYEIKDGFVYDLMSDEKTEINDLYDGINFDYIDLNYIFTMIYPRKYELTTSAGINTYKYEEISLEDGRNINITILTSKENINHIEIKERTSQESLENENIYILKYTNIGLVDSK